MNKQFGKALWLLMLLAFFGFSTAPRVYSQNENSGFESTGSVHITEFMAAPNDHIGARDLADEDGDKTDWIELYNDTGRVVDLAGWSLTDNQSSLQKWSFPPNTLLGPRRYLIVFASGKNRSVSSSELHTNFELKQTGEYLALVDDLAQIVFEIADEYPTQYTGISYGLDPQVTASEYSTRLRHFVDPTPGTLNTFNSGPSLSGVVHKPHRIGATVGMPVVPGENIVVTTQVESAIPLQRVTLEYRFGFGGSKTIPLLYQGGRLYSGIIPSARLGAGELVRYTIQATDQNGTQSMWPLRRNEPEGSLDYIRSPEALGTVIGYDQIDAGSRLPVLHWFVEPDPVYGWEWFREALDQHRVDFEEDHPDPLTRSPYNAWSFEDAGTSATVFYRGELYDNMFVRLRGKSTKNFDKKSFKFKFNKDYGFFFVGSEDPDGLFQVDEPFSELNLNTIGRDSGGHGDETYLREMVAWRAYRAAGVPYVLNFPIRLEQNGHFFNLSLFAEDINKRFLQRQNMSLDGSLFKLDYNDLGLQHIDTRRNMANNSNLYAVEQKSPKYDIDPRMSSVSTLISGINLNQDPRSLRERSDVTDYFYRHVDIASVINYLATRTVIDDWDSIRHNYWLYHDVANSGEWSILPWDKNETFPFPLDPTSKRENPLFGSWAIYNRSGEPPPELIFNRLYDGIFQDPTLRAMYLRRLKSVMDLLLGHPLNPNESSPLFEANIARYAALLEDDIQQFDRPRWQTTFDTSNLSNFVAERRVQLYDRNNFNSMIPLELLTADLGIRFGSIVRPSAGTSTFPNGTNDSPNQIEIAEVVEPGLEEIQQPYLTLTNCSLKSIDLSNWSISVADGKAIALKPGVVLPGQLYNLDALYIVPDVADFRLQASALRNGYPRFVQGGFDPILIGEEDQILYLRDAAGNEVTNSNQSTFGCPDSTTPHHTYLPVIQETVAPIR